MRSDEWKMAGVKSAKFTSEVRFFPSDDIKIIDEPIDGVSESNRFIWQLSAVSHQLIITVPTSPVKNCLQLNGLSNHVSTDTFTYFVACAASGFESGHPPPRRYCTALPRTPLTHTVQFAAQHLQAAMQQQLSCNCQFCIEPTLLHDSDVNCVLLKVNVNSVSCQTDAGGKSTVNATLSRLK